MRIRELDDWKAVLSNPVMTMKDPLQTPSDSTAPKIDRRRFLASSAAAAGALSFPSFLQGAQPEAKIADTRTISLQSHLYHGWPTVARRQNGELWLSWSGGREAHVCPFGQVCAMTSRDSGESWTYPRVLLDGAIDDRDSGVLETAKGTLIVTTFSSLAYVPYYEKKAAFAELTKGGWKTEGMTPEQFAAWKGCHDRLTDEEREAELGVWQIRSTDGGKTWSAKTSTIVNSPHGPIQLKDGRLLYAGKKLWTEEKEIGVCESMDDGLTWKWLAGIPTREGDTVVKGYHELHAVEAEDGTLIAQIRNHNSANKSETLQTESKDGGKTWSAPHSIGVWGLPSHLLKLRDGRLLITYGHRRAPYGCQARLSADNGQTWGEAMVIYGEGAGGDLGYPSTVEMEDGSLLTVWYEKMADQPKAVLRQARWQLG